MVIKKLLYFTLFIVYVLIINVVSCPPGALIWKIKYLVYLSVLLGSNVQCTLSDISELESHSILYICIVWEITLSFPQLLCYQILCFMFSNSVYLKLSYVLY